jgi:hypothetical protein
MLSLATEASKSLAFYSRALMFSTSALAVGSSLAIGVVLITKWNNEKLRDLASKDPSSCQTVAFKAREVANVILGSLLAVAEGACIAVAISSVVTLITGVSAIPLSVLIIGVVSGILIEAFVVNNAMEKHKQFQEKLKKE